MRAFNLYKNSNWYSCDCDIPETRRLRPMYIHRSLYACACVWTVLSPLLRAFFINFPESIDLYITRVPESLRDCKFGLFFRLCHVLSLFIFLRVCLYITRLPDSLRDCTYTMHVQKKRQLVSHEPPSKRVGRTMMVNLF